jgi:hypothetical protein
MRERERVCVCMMGVIAIVPYAWRRLLHVQISKQTKEIACMVDW